MRFISVLKMSARLPVIVLFIGSILWGLTWIPLKFFHQNGIEGIPLIIASYGVVALLILPVLFKQYPLWIGQQHYIWLILIIGGLANISFAIAVMYGDVVRVMILFYLLPAWGVLAGYIFLNEKISKQRLLSVILALSGAILVLGGFSILSQMPSWIDLLALAAGLFLALNNTVFRASSNTPIASKLSAQFLGTSVIAIIFFFTLSQTIPVTTPANWILVALFGLVWIFMASIATQWAVTHIDVGKSSILIIVELFTAVASAIIINNETLHFYEMVGGLLIVAAAFIEAKNPAN